MTEKITEEKNRKKKEDQFIQVIQGETKSETARKSMEDILAKMENAKKLVKKREELGF